MSRFGSTTLLCLIAVMISPIYGEVERIEKSEAEEMFNALNVDPEVIIHIDYKYAIKTLGEVTCVFRSNSPIKEKMLSPFGDEVDLYEGIYYCDIEK